MHKGTDDPKKCFQVQNRVPQGIMTESSRADVRAGLVCKGASVFENHGMT